MLIREIKIMFFWLCIASILIGCGASKAARKNVSFIEVHKPVIVEKTGKDNRPDWTSEKPFFENEDGLHFSGGYMGGADYSLTLRLAKAEATKNLLESVQIKVRSEFSNAIHGQNRVDSDLGRYVTDAVAWTVDNLRIGGIKQNQIYYEQIFDPISQSFKYNSWVQLRISTVDYVKAKTDAAQSMLNKAIQENDEEAKDKALELLEKLRQDA